MTTEDSNSTVTEWTLSRNLFKDFLDILIKEMDAYSTQHPDTPSATAWLGSEISASSKWRDMCRFAAKPSQSYSQTQSGSALIKKLLKHFPVMNEMFDFKHYGSGKVIITKKPNSDQKQEASSKKTTPKEEPLKNSRKENYTDANKSDWQLVQRGTKSNRHQQHSPTPIVEQKGNNNPFAVMGMDIGEDDEDGISYDDSNNSNGNPKSTGMPVSHNPTPATVSKPRDETNLEIDEIADMITKGQSNFCTTEQLARYVHSTARAVQVHHNVVKETSKNHTDDITAFRHVLETHKHEHMQAKEDIERQTSDTKGTLTNTVNDMLKKIDDHMASQINNTTNIITDTCNTIIKTQQQSAKEEMNNLKATMLKAIDAHCATQILETTAAINNNYRDTVKDMDHIREQVQKFHQEWETKMAFFTSIGDIVTQTEDTVKTVMEQEMASFQDKLTESTEMEIEALHNQAPESIMNDLIQRVQAIENTQGTAAETPFKWVHERMNSLEEDKQVQSKQLKAELKSRLDDMEIKIVDKYEQKLKEIETKALTVTKGLEAKITQLELKLKVRDYTQHRKIAKPDEVPEDNKNAMFQSPPPKATNSPFQPTDNSDRPLVPVNTLFDYQQGLLKLHNIRTISSHRGTDDIWRYTAVTASNTLVNDLKRVHMTNIRILDAEPQQPSSYPPPHPVPSPTHHQSHSAYRHMETPQPFLHTDDNSNAESSITDPIVVFVGHQYRYPKHSRTLSKVNYSYITDKGNKWNIKLKNEQCMKPFYDKLVNRMREAGVLLRSWDQIVKNESLAIITEANCDNYHSAYECMSHAIYNYLDSNKDDIFKFYSIPRGYIEGFRSTSDGFQVLYETLTANHPALVDLIQSKEDPVKPTLEQHQGNLYTFCNGLKDYYDYEYKGLSERPIDHQRKVLKYIRAQLDNDDRYEKAITYIDNELKRIYAKIDEPLPFPTELTLEGTVAVTLMKQLPRTIVNSINESLSSDKSSIIINKMNTRGSSRKGGLSGKSSYHKPSKETKYSKSHDNKDENSKQGRKPIDKVCPACGVSGHHIDITGCDKMAQFKILEEYNRGRNGKTIEKARKIYSKYQQDRHKRRNFDKEISQYKESIRTLMDEYDDVDLPTVKQMHLEAFREEVDPAANADIFDDVDEEYLKSNTSDVDMTDSEGEDSDVSIDHDDE